MTKQEILERAMSGEDFMECLRSGMRWDEDKFPIPVWVAFADFVAVSDVYLGHPVRWWWSDADGCWWEEAPWIRNGPTPLGRENSGLSRFITENRGRIAKEMVDGGRADLAMEFEGNNFPRQMQGGSEFQLMLQSALNIRNQFKE